MNDTAANRDTPDIPAQRPGPLLRLNGTAFVRSLGVVIVLASTIFASGSFLVMTGATKIEPAPEVWSIIWIVNAVLILMVVALVLTEVILMFRARRRKLAGARLQTRMVGMFAIMASIPAVIVAVVATIALDQGLDQWFSDRTSTMVENSRLVAASYLNEHAQVLRDDIIWVAKELESAHELFVSDRDKFQKVLTSLSITRSLPFTSLIRADTSLIMRAQINVPTSAPAMPLSIMPGVQEVVPTLISPGSTNFVGSVVKLRGYDDTYLFVARPVDPEVLEYMRLADQTITEYRQYASNRLVFQLTFAIMYVGVAVVLLLAALWIGIALANRFVAPIRNLMIASNRMSKGDMMVSVPVTEKSGDLHDLTIQFNQMTSQLRQQRRALVQASETNEKRRQFTEAVVEGVSAGIIGLDPFGQVTLVNSTACAMFDTTEVDLLREDIASVIPELAPILEKANQGRRGQLQDQIKFGPASDPRIYQVRLTREGSMTESKGYVITLDDMSELVTAQRNSAWADVARRIAHEIKNPLTPIQLSAERLRRRYANRVSDDSEIFDKCINTIVRQVGDIGKMVDEFSSFARMPAATQDRADLSDTIRHVVFLESVRQPEIELRVDLPETPIFAYFDHRLVSQALTNIIKNAVEAIERAGINKIPNPRIVTGARIEGDMVRVNVSDNGLGWPRENRHQLLEPYVTTRAKGTGLGLAIVAKIVEQHGGTIELRDCPADESGRIGACLSFTLPLQAPGQTGARPDGSADSEEAAARAGAGADL